MLQTVLIKRANTQRNSKKKKQINKKQQGSVKKIKQNKRKSIRPVT